ncbi:MAG: lipopolysaccharide biosynthesis protein [Leptolyngbyaceae cyanobacterium CSU_1_4]|nr:lipopolysaccharide biosynthesis protein [Leptolyngbyaceae cyanobacterium CSU_1_4]
MRNLGWLSIAEMVIRVSRLVTTVLLARFLSPYDYGLAAVVLSTNEFVQVFTRSGIGAKLIQVDEERLESLTTSAYWLNWLICGSLFIIQCLISFPIAWLYHDPKIALPICTIAGVYCIIPIAYIQETLIHRENRMKTAAIVSSVQVSVDNILTAILALLGFGMWAIVLPKVLVAPIWAIMICRSHPWRPGRFSTKHWQELYQFGRSVLGIELLKTLRNNLDYLLVGALIGIKELGIYYFAFNAGLGISLSFINAINLSLYPHLCAARLNWEQFKQRYFSSFNIITLVIVPIVLLQSFLAPFYVPIIFGQKWVVAVPILILICLSAIPRPFAGSASNLLLAIDKPNLDLAASGLFTLIFSVGLFIGANWGVLGIAISVLISHAVFQSLFTIWTTQYVFPSSKVSHP